MAQRSAVKTTYEVDRTLQPIYSGGSLALSGDGRILAASLGEDVLLSDLTTGKELGRVEGDGEAITSLICGFLYWTGAIRLLTWSSDPIGLTSHNMLAITLDAHFCSQSSNFRGRYFRT